MSNVQALAAVELPMGIITLLHYPDLTSGKLEIADLPDLTFRIVDPNTAKINVLFLRITSLSSDREAYNDAQIAALVRMKISEMLRLENVVEIYGNLPLAQKLDNYESPYHYDETSQTIGEIVRRLFNWPQGFRNHYHGRTEIVNERPGDHRMQIMLPFNLCVTASCPALEVFAGSHRAESNNQLNGSFVMGGKQWSFNIESESGLPIATALNFDSACKAIQAELSNAFPFANLDLGQFERVYPTSKEK